MPESFVPIKYLINKRGNILSEGEWMFKPGVFSLVGDSGGLLNRFWFAKLSAGLIIIVFFFTGLCK
jgi:hypothetical protein